MSFAIQRTVHLSREEKALFETWLDHHLLLLSVLPESQRFEEYARAQLAMAHHARFASELEEAPVADSAEHAPGRARR